MVSFRMTLSDLEWLSEIFNDRKHRAVSLRQLSFLYLLPRVITPNDYCLGSRLEIWFGPVTVRSDLQLIFNPPMGTGNYSATSNNMKLVHWPLMGVLLHLVQRGSTGRRRSPPRHLFAVPNVTAYPSTASVPITVLLYSGPLLCDFNVPVKGFRCTQKLACSMQLSLMYDRLELYKCTGGGIIWQWAVFSSLVLQHAVHRQLAVTRSSAVAESSRDASCRWKYVTRGHWKWHHAIDRVRVPIGVTQQLWSCLVSFSK